jgi:SAM-dependent MidA family methyltransferase
LVGIIAAEGPLALDRYMALCLSHPRHGYYMTRDPFGRAGDFITAPEVTQMFGEMIGIWCAQVYQLMGSPAAFDLIELGPGRGTLMADILRSAKVMPGMLAAARVRLIETSPRLRELQKESLRSWPGELSWHESLDRVTGYPGIVIGNEFFDALPVRQFCRTNGGWCERVVEVNDSKLMLGWKPSGPPASGQTAKVAEGEILELCFAASELGRRISSRLMAYPGAVLIIDYGHLGCARGETLQAVRSHRKVAILDRPGDSDLTAHVDFESLGRALASGGARVWAPLTQRQFLLEMGLGVRAQVLKNTRDRDASSAVDAAVARLTDQAQMGDLFKVISATSPGLSRPHPFVSELL